MVRYDARKQLVLERGKPIGTTYLRKDLLPKLTERSRALCVAM